MGKTRIILLVLVLALIVSGCGLPFSLQKEETEERDGVKIKGQVMDEMTSTPLEGVRVLCSGEETEMEAATNSRGRFTFRDVQPGEYTLRFETMGCPPKELEIRVRKNDTEIDLGEILMDVADRAEQNSESPAPAFSVGPSSGYAVRTPEGVAYWRYHGESFTDLATFGSFEPNSDTENELVLRSSAGEETVLLRDCGAGMLYYSDGRILYLRWNPVYYRFADVISVSMDGLSTIDCGTLLAPVELSGDGRRLIGNSDYSGGVAAVEIATGERTEISDGYLLAVRGDTVICHNGNGGDDTMFALAPDGTARRELISFDYSFGYGTGGYIIGETRFPVVDGVEYIYFSYGEIAGTGVFWQGGRVARARLDGGGGEIVAGMDELVAADFLVNPDGTVTGFSLENGRIPEGLYTGGTNYLPREGQIDWFEDDGTLTALFEKEDYAQFSSLDAGQVTGAQYLRIAEAGRTGDYAYLRIELCEEDDAATLGWRTGYRRLEGAVYLKERATGAAELLFRY